MEMKKIHIAIAAAALILTGCSKDFVSPRHNSSEPLDEYYNTEARMHEGLVAAYHPLTWFDYFNQYCPLNLVSDIMADDIYCGGESPNDQKPLAYAHLYTLQSTEQPNMIWTICYSGINRSCVVLQYVDGVEGMSDATKSLYKAEATVLKAFYYNLLWKFWGNVPYYDENLTSPYLTEQLDHDAVYEKIVTRLEETIDMGVLPMKVAGGNEGRVSLAMAYMLYAETVMYQKDQSRYSKALGYMKEIIESRKYDLVSDFAGIWIETGEWGAESIWEINYFSEGGLRDWGAPLNAGGQVYSVLTGINGYSGGIYYPGWGFGTVAKSAYDMFDDADIRKDASILNWEKHIAEVEPEATYSSERWENTGYFLNKYVARKNGNHGFLASDNLNFGNNLRYYRYAETLLNAAELSVLTGADGSSYLKQVRDRAHCPDTGTSIDDIIEERHKEFVGEGKRYWDLVRSGKAASVLKGSNHEYRERDWTESKKYWPIPQSELDKDPNLQQNNY